MLLVFNETLQFSNHALQVVDEAHRWNDDIPTWDHREPIEHGFSVGNWLVVETSPSPLVQ